MSTVLAPAREPAVQVERSVAGARGMDRVGVAVVGCGYWGPNLARNFDALPDAELAWLSDESPEPVERQLQRFPAARGGSFDELLADPARAHAMGAAGRRRAVEQFSWSAVAEQTVEVYRGVLGSGEAMAPAS